MTARALRIASLVAPSALAGAVILRVREGHVLHAAAPALAAVWVFMAGALVMRFVEASRPTQRSTDEPPASPWAHVDLLTPAGGAMMWAAAGALLASGLTGWASLSVVGLLGLGAVYLALAWTALVAGGDEPWRRATVARSVVPALAVEGDPLREEVRLAGVRIPAGMRLFAMGRTTRHGVCTRYALDSDGSGADVTLESDLGPAPRGEHRAPALALWLGDVLGLTRTPIVHRGEAAFTALPRPAVVERVRDLLGAGGDDALARPTHRLPTEGTFRIREYAPGDDMRRIHWVRSLQANQLVVRLPDEIPLAEPAVRLILDNELANTGVLATRAPDELLDAMVRIWLGIGKALAESGTRVTLVTAIAKDDAVVAVERPMLARTPKQALQLGACVEWQRALPPGNLIARAPVRQIVVSCRPRRIDDAGVGWVIVPEAAWTSPEPRLLERAPIRLPFPSGSPENRAERRRRDRLRVEQMWSDRAAFSQITCWVDWAQLSGAYVARPAPAERAAGGPETTRVALGVVP